MRPPTTPTIPGTLEQLAVPTQGLVPYGQNPRRGNVAVIVESLKRHGQYRPIVVRAGTNEVLAGNHTLAAARELGWPQVAATFVDVTDDEAARIALVDNRAADLGWYDNELLTELLASLPDLVGTGYSTDDLDVLLALAEPALEVGDLERALEEADASMWPWVRAQLPPEAYGRFQAVPGADDTAKLLELLEQLA